MANNGYEAQVYYIPENFIGESRLFQGRLSTRRLIDAAVVLLLLLMIALPLSAVIKNALVESGATKDVIMSVCISVIVILCAPLSIVSYFGYNGDPGSVFLKNYYNWSKSKETRIYNDNPRLLGTDPVKAIYESNQKMDALISKFEDRRKEKQLRKLSEEFIEGETFEFSHDPDIDDFLEDSGDFEDDDSNTITSDISISSSNDLAALNFLLNEDADGYNDDED